MKKLLLFLIAILTPFIFISKVNASNYFNGYGTFLNFYDGRWVNWNNYYNSVSGSPDTNYQWQFQVDGLYSFETIPNYAIVQLCTTSKITSYSKGSNFTSMTVQNTSNKCEFYGAAFNGTVSYVFLNFDGENILNNNCSASGDNCTDNNFNFAFMTGAIEIPYISNNYIRLMTLSASDTLPVVDSNTGEIITQNETIINQNAITNDKLQEANENIYNFNIDYQNESNQTQQKIDETNQNLDELNDNITNSDAPDGMDSLSSASGWLPPGPVDSLLTLPLSMLNNISTSLGSTCKPIDLPIPFVDKNLTMPCLNTIYSQISGLGVFLNSIGTIAAGFMLYYYFKKLYAYIDNLLSLKNNGEGWGDV